MRKTAVDWFNKAEALWDEDEGKYTDPKEAIAYLDKAIKLKPDYAEAYVERGIAYIILGEQQRAIEDCNKSIRLKPDFVKGYNIRGAAYFKLGQYQQSIKDYDDAIFRKPCYFKAFFNRGLAYGMLGRYERGIEDCNEAIRLKPYDVEAHSLKDKLVALKENVTQQCNLLRIGMETGYFTWDDLKYDEDFDSIRNTTAFIELLKEEEQKKWMH